MVQRILKCSMIFIAILLSLKTHALIGYVTIDGIRYYVVTKGKTAQVANQSPEDLPDEVVIPATIECEGIVCNVTSIDDRAFSETSIKSVIIPNSVTSIGEEAFYHCKKLISATLPSSITSIEKRTFYQCKSLTSVNIPGSVTKIGSEAFRNCDALTSMVIPNSVTYIEAYAFYGCANLKSVTISNSLAEIGSLVFSKCTGLTSVTIPYGVTTIGGGAFYYCTSLTSVNIPNSVKTIGGSFIGCSSLTSVTIPESVTTIASAFSDCPELADVYCYSVSPPEISDDAFGGSFIGYATLHVPASSIELYENTKIWEGFGTIIALTQEETGVEGINDNWDSTMSTNFFSLDGISHKTLQKGVNIIHVNDGTTKKIYMP